MIGATDRGLCFLQFGDTRKGLLAMLEKDDPLAELVAMGKPYHPDFQKWVDALNGYLAGTHVCPWIFGPRSFRYGSGITSNPFRTATFSRTLK
jgi:hypothetical protein